MRNEHKKTLRVAGALVALAVAAGCATAPANETLERARSAYRGAQSDAHVTRFAPAELAGAGETLNRAESLSREGADSEEVTHAAYLAEQRAYIAREAAMLRAGEAQLAQASETRNRVVLEARAREAESERNRAAMQVREAEQERAAALARAHVAESAQARQAEEARLQAKSRMESDMRALEAQVSDLKARETERGWMLALRGDVLFDAGQATLKPGGRRAVDQLAALMRQQEDRQIIVEGFTDSTGSSEMNQALSERRAQAVRQALLASGVAARRVKARGLGQDYPVASNSTQAGRLLNRRVEILLPNESSASAGR